MSFIHSVKLAVGALALIATPVMAQSNADYAAPRFLEGTGSAEADGVFPRLVTDEVGEVLIESQPERIVVIQTGQLDGALNLGVVPVGAARGLGLEVYGEYQLREFPDLAEEIAAITDIGARQEPDLEAIAQLQPDLIFINSAAMDQETYDAMNQIAPVVVTKGRGNNWKVDFLLIGHALGKSELAQDWLDDYHAEAEAVAERWDDGNVPTVSLVHSNGTRTRVMGVASFAGSIVQDMGLDRPESQYFDGISEDISPELLDLADADWIFYSGQGDGIALIEEAPLWGTLEGVTAGQAEFVEYEPFYFNAGPSAAMIVLRTTDKAIR